MDGPSEEGPRPTGLGRRLSYGFVDQLFSSGSNFLALLLGARYLGIDGFGSYSLTLLTYTIILGLTRALCCEALLVRPGEDPAECRSRQRDAVASAIWLGLGFAACLAVAALVTTGTLSRCLIVLALSIPGLLLQDTLRYGAFANGVPGQAVASDGLWLGSYLIGVPVVLSLVGPTAPVLLATWTAPGVLAGLVLAIRFRLMPSLGRFVTWIGVNRDLSIRYALDFMSGAGAAQAATYVLALVAGVGAVGSIRGAQTLFGPVNILLTGSYIVLVPEGHRAARRSDGSLTKLCVAAAASLMSLAAVLVVVFLNVSQSQGEAVLGGTWNQARDLIIPVGLASMAGGVLAGAIAGLRSLAAASRLLRLRAITIPTSIALPVGGAIFFEARGLAYGIAASVWWNVGWYWRGYFAAVAEFGAGEAGSSPSGIVPIGARVAGGPGSTAT